MNEIGLGIVPQFVHVLLFRCGQCSLPLTAVSLGDRKNLEHADAQPFLLNCRCGWSQTRVGVMAVKHWVEEWEAAESSQLSEQRE